MCIEAWLDKVAPKVNPGWSPKTTHSASFGVLTQHGNPVGPGAGEMEGTRLQRVLRKVVLKV